MLRAEKGKRRRFSRKPDCLIIPLAMCDSAREHGGFYETGECPGYGTSDGDDEPHPCCQACGFLTRDLREDA